PKVDVGVFRLMAGDWYERDQSGGTLGLRVVPSDRRALVTNVLPDQPAAQAGILVGDRLLAIDGRDVDGLGPSAIRFLMTPPPGTKVTLSLETTTGTRRTAELVTTKPRP